MLVGVRSSETGFVNGAKKSILQYEICIFTGFCSVPSVNERIHAGSGIS